MPRSFLALLALSFGLFAGPLTAHEFWLSPDRYVVPEGAPLRVHIRVGQGMVGNPFSYVPRRTERFEVLGPDGPLPFAPVVGDRPAVARAAAPDGLVVVVHETTDSRLTYRDWTKFGAFAAEKGLDGLEAAHLARGLPREGFVETYRRFAKTLVAGGAGAGADRVVGLRTEIVALANPYVDDVSGGMAVRVLLDGAPRADAQVELWERASGPGTAARTAVEGARSVLRTDRDGMVLLPVRPGHEYMVDATLMEPRTGDVAWHSLWANLTFAVPPRE